MKYAIVDIGTNSQRLLIFQNERDFDRGVSDSMVTKLGEGLRQSGMLKAERMQESFKCYERFQTQLERAGVLRVEAFATAAVREAQNGRDFVKRITSWFPWNVRILAEEEEALIGFLGARLSVQEGPITVIDIGGGSTEIIMGEDKPEKRWSFPVGALKLSEDPDLDLNRYFKDLPPMQGSLLGIGGSIASFASMALGLDQPTRKEIQNFNIDQKALQERLQSLGEMSLEERRQIRGLDPKRAELIQGGLRILQFLMEYFETPSLRYSDYGNLEGYALSQILWKQK